MSLLERIRAFLFPPPGPDDGAAVLRRLRVDGVLLSWAHKQGSRSLAELWRACPRPDWLIDLAARAGVRRALVGDALESCLAALDESGGAGAAEIEEAAVVGSRWVAEGGSPGPLVASLAVVVNQVCDADEDVVAARLAGREPIGREFPEARINADLAEHSALMHLAEKVRARLRYDELHAAIFDEPARRTPYR